MSDLEEVLLDSDEEEAPRQKRENSTIKQMREATEAATAAAKAAEERAVKAERALLSTSGLSEKQAAVFQAAGYEASAEGIEAFRSEVLGVAEAPKAEEPQVQESVEEPEEVVEAPFQPTAGSTTAAPKREVTSKEFLQLLETDPVKADKLLREGRVVHANFNPGGPAF